MLPDEPSQNDTRYGPLRRDDVKFATGRITLFQYLALAVFLFLISGFWDLQVRNPEFYSEQAERNRIKALPIPAPAGRSWIATAASSWTTTPRSA